jgi:hypothetical protein
MTQTVREINTDQAWDDLVDAADHATVYHRSGWLAALDATTGAPMRRLVLDSDNGPLALWPIAILRKGPIRVAGSPLPGWNTAYLGPLFLPACSDKAGAVATMMRASPVRRPAFVATRTMDTGVDLSPLGFRKTREFETFEMDLTLPEQALWDNLKSTCRTRIRKGEKNGLEVREENDEAYIDSFWQMATDVFAKSNQRPPYSLAFLRQIESHLRQRGELLVTSAFLGSERVATLIIPHDQTTAMYFAGGSLASRLDLAPNNLLHWRTMLLCQKRGLKRYDFISNRGSPGRFKATFNPVERVSAVHWESARSALLWHARRLYEARARRSRRLTSGDPS